MNTVSLEVAKKLKAAGWLSETYWLMNNAGTLWRNTQIAAHNRKYFIAAPTLGELMRALPFGSELRHAYPGDTAEWYCVAGGEEYCATEPEDAAAEAWIALNSEND